jgi:LPXTG-motif cell wall-anchored protein
MKKLSKDAESRILTALESVADSVNEGTSPNDAIVKAASAHDIPAGHINLMVSAYNTGRTGKQRMAAESPFDKAATFELADHSDIMGRLYPTHVKSAAQKRDETVIDDEYSQAPAFAQHKKAAQVAARKVNWQMVDTAPEPYPGEAHTPIKRAFHATEFNKRRFEECRREVARAKDLLTSNFEKLSNYFRTPGGVSFDDACDAVEIQHGGMGKAILNQISRTVPQFSKEAKHNCSAMHPDATHEQWMALKKKKRQEKSAGIVEVQPTQAPWVWVRESIKLASDIHEKQRELAALSQHVVKSAEDRLRPFSPRQGRSVLNLPLPATNEKQSSMAPLYGAGAGLAGGGLLHYLRNKDKDEDEERSSLLGDLAMGGAVGLGGGLAYDAFAGTPEVTPEVKPTGNVEPVADRHPGGSGGGTGMSYSDLYTDQEGNTYGEPEKDPVTGNLIRGEMMPKEDPSPSEIAAAEEEFKEGPFGQAAQNFGQWLGGGVAGDDTSAQEEDLSYLSEDARERYMEQKRLAEEPEVDSDGNRMDQNPLEPNVKQSGVGSIYALSHLFRNTTSGMENQHEAQKAAVRDYLEELDNPAHAADIKRIHVRAQLENMMANDPVLSLEDPAMIAEAYNEIVQLSPSAADSPLMMRNLLRQHLSTQEGGGGIMDPRDIGANIIDNEKSLQEIQQGNDKQVVTAPGHNAVGKNQVSDIERQQTAENAKSVLERHWKPVSDAPEKFKSWNEARKSNREGSN